MEPTGLKKQIISRIVIYTALAILAYGILATFYTKPAILLAKRQDAALNILVLTQNPVFISYNPKYRKAIVTNLESAKTGQDAASILQKANIDERDVLFFEPQTRNTEKFWNSFKHNLYGWRSEPYIIFTYIWDYIRLRFEGKTNITAGTFIMLTFDLQTLLPSDFSVKAALPMQVKRKGRAARKQQEPEGPQIALAKNIEITDEKPILIEIVNATDKSGLAAQATRYLRRLNNDGALNLDIINYKTAPKLEKKTHIIDYSGRVADLQNISKYLDLDDTEILRQTDKTAIVEAKIVLGQDFRLPKALNK